MKLAPSPIVYLPYASRALPLPEDENSDNRKRQNDATGISEGQKYDAAQIDKLEGLEAVRKRPGMYIGDPDERGLHHMVFEVLDNSIDEHLAGYCTKIEVAVHVDGSVSIRDNGRGIPVDMHPKFKMPAVELVLTNLHAGGKFGQGAYKYSGGLHGVGAKCVNALSDWFKVEVSRDGKVYPMGFERGKTTQKLEVIGEVKNKKNTGTLITFMPDPTIFTITTEFKFERLASRLRELAFLNPGLEITLTDERGDQRKRKRSSTSTASKSSSSNSARISRSFIRSRSCFHGSATKCLSMSSCSITTATTTRFCVRQFDSQSGRRHAPDRFPHRADQGRQPVRQVEQPSERQGSRDFRRRRARRSDLRAEHQAAQSRVSNRRPR